MTTGSRFDRQLPAFIEDLYLGPSPDYRDDVLAAATAGRQRPAWTFPGRWLPMADIADRRAFAPHVPWRTIGAVVLIALLLAAAVLYVGTRPARVPPPFGPARNGGIVFANGGDVFIGDPASGTSRAIVTGPEMDGNPLFARDGTRVAFMRRMGDPATPTFAMVVAKADGSGPKTVATNLDTDGPYEWSPDGSYLVFTDTEFRVYRIDATGARPPQLLVEHAYVQPGEFRPPDGRQILYEPQDVGATGSQTGHKLWVMNSDGSGQKPMVEIPAERARKQGDFESVRYSPDGTMIAFEQAPLGDTSQLRIFIMNADGSHVRPLTTETGAWVETNVSWSPDGKRIAFDRWHLSESQEWQIQPIGLASVDGGAVTPLGPTPVSDGAWLDFSPDGASIISIPASILGESYPTNHVQPTMIDVTTGQTRTLDWPVGSMLTWQRLAD